MQYLAAGVLALVALAVVIALLRRFGGAGSTEDPELLARLLVSEIKLYNSDRIEQGRQANAILTEVREDVERSREMYLERVGEQDPSGQIFDQALIRILADGDPSALGS